MGQFLLVIFDEDPIHLQASLNSVRARPLSRLIVVRRRMRSGVGVMISTASISIFSPRLLSPRVTVTFVALSLSRGSKVARTARISRARVSRSKSRDERPGEGRHAVVDDASTHLRKIGERRRIVRRLFLFQIGKKRSGVEALGIEQRLDVTPHSLPKHTGRHHHAAAFELHALLVLKGQSVQPPLLIGCQLRIGVDQPRTAGKQRIETVRAKLVLQEPAATRLSPRSGPADR